MIHFPTYELCQKAKELGFRQDTGFSYRQYGNGTIEIKYSEYELLKFTQKLCSAPTLDEVLEELPQEINRCDLQIHHTNDLYYFGYYDYDWEDWAEFPPVISNTNPAQILELWCELKEKGII